MTDKVSDFKVIKDFNVSKAEQNDIRAILQTLPVEGRNSINAIPNDIPQIDLEECCNKEQNKRIKNLQEEIAILKKRCYFDQQLSQKTRNDLRQKLETEKLKCRNACTLQKKQQSKVAKQQYSDVIKTLKNELFQTKDHFVTQQSLQQSLWLAEKVMMEQKNEKLESSLKDLQQTVKKKDENSQQMVQSLTEEVSDAKAEIQRLQNINLNNEKKLNENEKVINNIKAKNEETQRNIAEALNLVEYLIKETNDVLQREAKLVEQNVKLETQLASIIKDDPIKMQEEMIKLKNINAHQDDAKKYFKNIEELKSALQVKDMLISQLRKEKKSLEDEKNKVELENKSFLDLMYGSAVTTVQDFFQRIFGQTSSDTDSKTCDKCKCELHSLKVQQLPEKFTNLEEDLVILNDELKKSQQQNPTGNVKDCKKLTDEKTKENDTSARLVRLENQLIDATNAKESLTSKIILQMTLDCEKSAKRTSERTDTSIHPVQGSFQHCEDTINTCTLDTISTCTLDTISTCTLDESIENINDEPESLLVWKIEQRKYYDDKMKKMKHFVKTNKNFSKSIDKPESLLAEQKKQQECFDKKIKEMQRYEKHYKNLSKRWTSETKTLTEKFRVKFKELRRQMSILKKKNVKLEKELRLLNKTSCNNS